MPVLKVRDPADPTGQSWISLPQAGPTGPTGPTGPAGPASGLPLTGGTLTGPLTINVAGGSNSVVFAAPGFPNIDLLRSGDELHISQDNRGVGLAVHPYYARVGMALEVGTDLTVGGTITDSGGPVMNSTDRESLRTELEALRVEVAGLKGRISQLEG